MFPRARPLVGSASMGVGGEAWKGRARAPLGVVTDVRVCGPRRPARRAWATWAPRNTTTFEVGWSTR